MRSREAEEMILTKAYLIPVIFGLWLPITFIITYVIAVLKDHVKPILPYISDTGGRAPESSIFGVALTIAGVLMIMTVYIRFRQVKNLVEERDLGVVTSRLNNSGLYMGVLATFGCLITANFQVTNALPVHIFGAMMCFGLLIVFQIVQVIISFRMYPTFGSKAVNIIRLIFALMSSIGLGISNIAGIISLMESEGGDMMKWTKDEKGYFMHLTSVIVEYIVLFSTIFFITTFTGEFKMVHFQEPVLIVSYVPNGLERKICTKQGGT
ncbi:unnamed protein product [Phaedon cochleariae]|uniref:CWH43-like N-terminal domain-containing protein n=1 Tax=Phaedon cochleariae TaxID=80249 RepID=A0A9P0DTB8_PHACE|nr:unnamed protein product [Phaedon cochleariae]